MAAGMARSMAGASRGDAEMMNLQARPASLIISSPRNCASRRATVIAVDFCSPYSSSERHRLLLRDQLEQLVVLPISTTRVKHVHPAVGDLRHLKEWGLVRVRVRGLVAGGEGERVWSG